MKAMILAAGRSTRLGKLGEGMPKPMLSLGGRPLLVWTLERLRSLGVSEVVINLHHAPEVIPTYFEDGSAWGLQITYLVEPSLLGTAGGVYNARHLLDGEPFLVVYGDTVLDWDFWPMIVEHRALRPIATIAVAEVEDPSQLGIVGFDEQGWIRRFTEKPGSLQHALGRWVNAGLYVLEPDIFEEIPAREFSDFGSQIFPAVLQRGLPLRAYRRPSPLMLIDTSEQFKLAQQAWIPLEPMIAQRTLLIDERGTR